MHLRFRHICLLGLYLFLAPLPMLAQNIVPASIFGNEMVLQQGIHAPIWGTATPNQRLTVSFAGYFLKTRANKAGRWIIHLPEMKAGGPFRLRISTAKDSVVFNNVFIGEVWLASGQSNMQLTLPEVNNAVAEIAAAQYPAIRFFTVEHNISSKSLDKVKGEWKTCTPENARKFSAVAYFFARALYLDKQVPVGILSSSWGATPSEAWTSGESLINHPDFRDSVIRYRLLQEDWEALYANYLKETAVAKTAVPGSKAPVVPAQKNYPTALYNAMIAPLVPYGIKGVIWYQGENNAKKAIQYRSLFPLLITDWRAKWKNDSLPFIFVQLANFKARNTEPVFNDDWALLREAQSMALQIPYTAMAVTIDIGDAKTIHPKNKQDVGKRLYLAANHVAYHVAGEYSGPQYASMRILDNKIELEFLHTGSGLVSNATKLAGFTIAGADKKFYWAEAVISGDKVIVSSAQVPHPVAVRYAWSINPDASLYNKEGLPASPFRTDDW
ncbi:MAG: sialate O-acetylesterase [Bacteroidota bacterium]|nr:sialate O-acetylesterase [Bacteroidota bacterium]